jgi:hypothetical protein
MWLAFKEEGVALLFQAKMDLFNPGPLNTTTTPYHHHHRKAPTMKLLGSSHLRWDLGVKPYPF